MSFARIALTALCALATVTACAHPAIGPRVTATRETPPPSPPASSTPTPSATSLGKGPNDLRQMDWRQASVPGRFCDIDGLVRFRDGEATALSGRWGQVHLAVRADQENTTYGDLDGDGKLEVALAVGCDNGGGTAAGQLGFGYVIIGSQDGELVAIGTITPRREPEDLSHVTLLGDARIERGEVVVTEYWYRGSDATCCPSGRTQTTWHLRDDALVAGESVPIS